VNRRHPSAGTAAPLALLIVLLAGCGGSIPTPDLFVVQRSGSVAGARLTLLVNDGGYVRCNGAGLRPLSDPLLIDARAIKEGLEAPAGRHESLPAQPGSVLSYSLRDENGTVRFSDNSRGQPSVFHELTLFVLRIAKDICRLAL
jgi:hypothetical protein